MAALLVVFAGANHASAQQWTKVYDHDFGISNTSNPAVATDPRLPFGTTQFTTLALPPLPNLTDNKFEVIHACLIPKGPHRGKVLVWNEAPVYAAPPQTVHNINPNGPTAVMWAFQQWSIFDPSDTPAGPRFRNFFLPIAEVRFVVQPDGSVRAYGADIFCSGHVWDHNGNLIVVGGTEWNFGQQLASSMTWIFDPDQQSAPFPNSAMTGPLYPGEQGMWLKGPPLASQRYYPTAVFTHALGRAGGRRSVIVLGGDNGEGVGIPSAANSGSTALNATWNTYETILINNAPRHPSSPGGVTTGLTPDVVNGQRTFDGPGQPIANSVTADWLWYYPRAHLMTTGEVIVTGFTPQSRSLDHNATPTSGAPPGLSNWHLLPTGSGTGSVIWPDMRTYGASVRLPNVFGNSNFFARIGGLPFLTADLLSTLPPALPQPHLPGPLIPPIGSVPVQCTNTVEVIDAVAAPPAWVAAAPMHHKRAVLNAVLLPNATIAVFGGGDQLEIDPSGQPVQRPVLSPEIFSFGTGWTLGPPALSPRTYHSITLLLDDGRVLVAGGDSRTKDYEIFEPSYLQQGVRPTNIVLEDTSGAVLPTEVLQYGQQIVVRASLEDMEFGTFLSRVVLMAPGATTHHRSCFVNSTCTFSRAMASASHDPHHG